MKSRKPNLYLSYPVWLIELNGYRNVTLIVIETMSDEGNVFSMHVVQLLDVIDCYSIVESDASDTKTSDEQLKNKKALMQYTCS